MTEEQARITQTITRRFIETLLLILVLALFWTLFVEAIWKSLFFSVLLAITFTGVYEWFKPYIGTGKSAAFIVAVLLAVPTALLIAAVSIAFGVINDLVLALQTEGSDEQLLVLKVLGRLTEYFPVLENYLANPGEMLKASGIIGQNINTLAEWSTITLGVVATTAMEVVGFTFVVMFGLYYLLIDGRKPLTYMRFLIPVRSAFIKQAYKEFAAMTRSMMKVTLMVGTIQGTIGGLALLAIGTPSWFMWTITMIIFSMIPILGAGLVLVPTAAVYFLIDEPTKAVIVLAVFVFVSLIDNWLKPMFVRNDVEMHNGWVLLGMVAGLLKMGPIGVIAGPPIMALCLSYIDTYGAMRVKGWDEIVEDISEME